VNHPITTLPSDPEVFIGQTTPIYAHFHGITFATYIIAVSHGVTGNHYAVVVTCVVRGSKIHREVRYTEGVPIYDLIPHLERAIAADIADQTAFSVTSASIVS